MASAWSWILNSLRRTIDSLRVFSDGRHLTEDELSAVVLSLEQIYREMIVAETLNGLNQNEQAALDLIRVALDGVRTVYRIVSEADNCGNQPPVSYTGLVGRPKFAIPRQQLVYLIENNFSVPQISEMLGVSIRTIRRRMTEYGLSVAAQYATLTDDDLDQLVHSIQEQFPMCGNKQMQGHLLSRGVKVQQLRIRESQRRLCPEGTLLRRLGYLQRRKYRVAGPRSLYHIDGNHKLIRSVQNDLLIQIT